MRERVLLLSPVLLIEIKEQQLKEKLFNNNLINHRCPFMLFYNVLHNSQSGIHIVSMGECNGIIRNA